MKEWVWQVEQDKLRGYRAKTCREERRGTGGTRYEFGKYQGEIWEGQGLQGIIKKTSGKGPFDPEKHAKYI